MAERTSITQVTQIGVETTPGTSVAANKRLPSVMANFGFGGNITEVRGSGIKFSSAQVLGKEWAAINVPGQPITYDEIVYFLSSLMGYAAPVQQAATTAYLWTHDVNSTAEDTVKTFTIEQGSAVRAHKATYCQAVGMTIGGDREKVDFSAELMGRAISDGITLTASPTALPLVPVLAKDVSVYADDTGAALGTTKLDRVLSWSLELKNKVGPLWVVDRAQTSYAAVVELAIDASLKLMVEADSNGMAFLTNMRAGTPKFFRIEAQSATEAGTANPYKLTLDFAGAVGDMPGEFSDRDGVFATEFTFKGVHDSTWNKAITASVVNKQTTL